MLALVAADVAASRYPAAVRDVAAALKYRYHDFDHYNLKDPLDELLFIICSTKTPRCQGSCRCAGRPARSKWCKSTAMKV